MITPVLRLEASGIDPAPSCGWAILDVQVAGGELSAQHTQRTLLFPVDGSLQTSELTPFLSLSLEELIDRPCTMTATLQIDDSRSTAVGGGVLVNDQ